ncbi:MAG: hypothetical protein HQK76_04020 [Desulfobacterales bacterium]|nr:hypothetical protein [Desulfobacterales bacterium]
MAKQLIFQKDKDYSFYLNRLDRKKLYGWKDIVATYGNNEECVKVEIDMSEALIIPKGGKALGVLDNNGNWVDKKDLKAVYKDGTQASLIPSVFDQPIKLDKTVTIDEFLDYCIESVYIIQTDEPPKELIEHIRNSDEIFTFQFNYREGYESSTAFLMESKDALFILTGYCSQFEFIGLEQMAEMSLAEEEEDVEDTEEELDFSMM